MCITGNENTHHEITCIPQCALFCTFPIRNTSILVYLQHVPFLLAGVLSNEIVMLSFPGNQQEAAPLKCTYFIKSLFPKCRKRLLEKLAKECSKNIDGNKMIYNGTLNNYRKICNSCTEYTVLLVVFFIISISIRSVFIYFHWFSKITCIETLIYKRQINGSNIDKWLFYKWQISKKLTKKIGYITFLMT